MKNRLKTALNRHLFEKNHIFVKKMSKKTQSFLELMAKTPYFMRLLIAYRFQDVFFMRPKGHEKADWTADNRVF